MSLNGITLGPGKSQIFLNKICFLETIGVWSIRISFIPSTMIPNGLKFFHYLNFKKSFQIVSKAL